MNHEIPLGNIRINTPRETAQAEGNPWWKLAKMFCVDDQNFLVFHASQGP